MIGEFERNKLPCYYWIEGGGRRGEDQAFAEEVEVAVEAQYQEQSPPKQLQRGSPQDPSSGDHPQQEQWYVQVEEDQLV